MTTFVLWVNSLEAMTVTGVLTRYTSGPPEALSTADLPAQWCSLPRAVETPIAFQVGGGDVIRTVDFIVALEAVGQNNIGPNFDATVTMMDAIATALRTLETTSLLDGNMTWRSRMAIVNINGNDYWAVVTEIEGEDLP